MTAQQDSTNAELLTSLGLCYPIIPEKLLFTSMAVHPQPQPGYRFLCIDTMMVYRQYFADFGPLNICHVAHFCRIVDKILAELDEGDRLVFYSSQNAHQRANAACIILCYAVVRLKHTPAQASALLAEAYPPFVPFRDAGLGIGMFNLTIHDVLCGLYRAMQLGWFKFETFDTDEYIHYDQPENGDLNWIVPGLFVALSTPVDDHPGHEPERLIKPLRDRNVQLMVRLNEPMYDNRTFTHVGIRHVDLFFEDGSIPPDHISAKFLKMVEQQKSGAVAVHCKAGLGRTGTLIGMYCIKHFGVSAREFIGWSRLCRPGMVMGPQQQFLVQAEARLTRDGNAERSAIVRKEAAATKRAIAAARSSNKPMPTPEAIASRKKQGRHPTELKHATPIESKVNQEEQASALFDPTFVPRANRQSKMKFDSSRKIVAATPTLKTLTTTAVVRSASAMSGRAAPVLGASVLNDSACSIGLMGEDRRSRSALGQLRPESKAFTLRSATPTALEMSSGGLYRSALVGSPGEVIGDMLPTTECPARRAIEGKRQPMSAHRATIIAGQQAGTVLQNPAKASREPAKVPWLSGTPKSTVRLRAGLAAAATPL